MNQKQKKYTVYEIEKLTKGKLTKYKLTKAIHANELNAEEVKEKKRGRGIPNFFIYENDLNEYLQKIEENKKKPKKLSGFSARLQKAMEEAEKQKKARRR